MLGLSAPFVSRPNPAKWLSERGIVRPVVSVYGRHEGHTSFRKLTLGPQVLVRRPFSLETERTLAGIAVEQHKWNRPIEYWDADLYEILFAPTLTFLTSTSTSNQTVSTPADWNNASNYVDCIGTGGWTSTGDSQGWGGHGGAWARKNNVSLTGSITYRLSAGTVNIRRDTWFNGTTLASASVGAEGGETLADGGTAANSVGDTKYSGGSGHAFVSAGNGGGGGGAGGLNGNGVAAPDENGGAGDNGSGGTGGVGTRLSTGNGGNGGNGAEYDATHGSGGGGGGSGNAGGDGGLYGGGAGAGGFHEAEQAGRQGLIVLRYTPGTAGARVQLIFVG